MSSAKFVITEALESRRLFSTSLSYDGMISVSGTQYADMITVNTNGSTVTVTEQVTGQPATSTSYRAQKIKYISINGLEGDDFISNNTGVNSYIDGYKGNDNINGGYGADAIYGREGADTINGRDGDDYIDAASENNWVSGGLGNDTLVTWHGADTMLGSDGNDYLRSYGGADQLYGGNGNDSLIGGYGNDSLFGENGVDYLWGQEHDDYLNGGTTDSQPDGLIGGAGNDTFVTHWVKPNANEGYRNYSYAYDFQYYDYGSGLDRWVNP